MIPHAGDQEPATFQPPAIERENVGSRVEARGIVRTIQEHIYLATGASDCSVTDIYSAGS